MCAGCNYNLGYIPRIERLKEVIKWIPLLYAVAVIFLLYILYAFVHLPDLPSGEAFPQAVVFHAITAMLLVNYVCCIFVAPGEVPHSTSFLS